MSEQELLEALKERVSNDTDENYNKVVALYDDYSQVKKIENFWKNLTREEIGDGVIRIMIRRSKIKRVLNNYAIGKGI